MIVALRLQLDGIVTSRTLYTSCTRATDTIDLVGPLTAFDNPEVHRTPHPRTTALAAYLDINSFARTAAFNAIRPNVPRMSSMVSLVFRRSLWTKWSDGDTHASCSICDKCVSMSRFHIAENVHVRANDELDKELLCPSCQLTCGTRSFEEFRAAQTLKELSDVQRVVLDFIRRQESYAFKYKQENIEKRVASKNDVDVATVKQAINGLKSAGLIESVLTTGSSGITYMTYGVSA